MQEIDLHQGLESTLVILGYKLKRKSITLMREYDSNMPLITAYGRELNQVWTNLIDNAIDAMDEGGKLRIRTLSEPSVEQVLVEIRDNGAGIPPEVKERIFEPFFTTKEVGEGTGLGLDTAHRIVRKHHGYIRVKSQPGDTRFCVYLPIKQPI